MSHSRLKRKALRKKGIISRRKTSLKIQNFKPVVRSVDIEKIKEEFKAKQ